MKGDNENSTETRPLIVLVGPTAIGKTNLSIQIAKEFGCEIVGMDSMQVYRYMDIGTAKISPEEQQGIRHHLIDIVNPDENYDAASFVEDCSNALDKIYANSQIPLLTGGTGLYLKAFTEGLFEGVPRDEEIRKDLNRKLTISGSHKMHEELSLCDPDMAKKIHPNDTSRVIRGLEIYLASGRSWTDHLRAQKRSAANTGRNMIIIGLTCPREKLYSRINLRVDIMLNQGLEGEVLSLLERGYHGGLKSMNSIGYRHMVNYLSDMWKWEEMRENLARDTRRYAKRQYTWFNKTEDLEWYEVEQGALVIDRIGEWLDR